MRLSLVSIVVLVCAIACSANAALATRSNILYSGEVYTMSELYALNETVVDPNELTFSYQMRGSSANGIIVIDVTDPSTLIVDGGAGTRAQNITITIASQQGRLTLQSLENHLGPQAFGSAANFSLRGYNTNRDGFMLAYNYELTIRVPGRVIKVQTKSIAADPNAPHDANGQFVGPVVALASAYVYPNDQPYQMVGVFGNVNSADPFTSVVRGFRVKSPYPPGPTPYLRPAFTPVGGSVRNATLDGHVLKGLISVANSVGSLVLTDADFTAVVHLLDDDLVRVELGYIKTTTGLMYILDNSVIRLYP